MKAFVRSSIKCSRRDSLMLEWVVWVSYKRRKRNLLRSRSNHRLNCSITSAIKRLLKWFNHRRIAFRRNELTKEIRNFFQDQNDSWFLSLPISIVRIHKKKKESQIRRHEHVHHFRFSALGCEWKYKFECRDKTANSRQLTPVDRRDAERSVNNHFTQVINMRRCITAIFGQASWLWPPKTIHLSVPRATRFVYNKIYNSMSNVNESSLFSLQHSFYRFSPLESNRDEKFICASWFESRSNTHCIGNCIWFLLWRREINSLELLARIQTSKSCSFMSLHVVKLSLVQRSWNLW